MILRSEVVLSVAHSSGETTLEHVILRLTMRPRSIIEGRARAHVIQDSKVAPACVSTIILQCGAKADLVLAPNRWPEQILVGFAIDLFTYSSPEIVLVSKGVGHSHLAMPDVSCKSTLESIVPGMPMSARRRVHPRTILPVVPRSDVMLPSDSLRLFCAAATKDVILLWEVLATGSQPRKSPWTQLGSVVIANSVVNMVCNLEMSVTAPDGPGQPTLKGGILWVSMRSRCVAHGGAADEVVHAADKALPRHSKTLRVRRQRGIGRSQGLLHSGTW